MPVVAIYANVHILPDFLEFASWYTRTSTILIMWIWKFPYLPDEGYLKLQGGGEGGAHKPIVFLEKYEPRTGFPEGWSGELKPDN